jgi:hypothetical protein
MDVQEERVTELHRLHERGCFVMPNPWDAGSAWTLGRPDNDVRLDEALAHLAAIAAAVRVLGNAELGVRRISVGGTLAHAAWGRVAPGRAGDRPRGDVHRLLRPAGRRRPATPPQERGPTRVRTTPSSTADAAAQALPAPPTLEVHPRGSVLGGAG